MEAKQIIKDLNLEPVKKSGLLEKLKNFSKKEKILVGTALIVCLLFLTLLIVSAIMKGKGQEPIKVMTPTPTPTVSQEEIIELSLYATDSAILKIEKEIKETKATLENMDKAQKNLDIPSLDMDISFEK